MRRLLLGAGKDVRDAFDAYARALYAKVVAHIGFAADRAKDDHRSPQLRAVVFARSCACRDPTAVATALAQWDAYVATGAEISADLRGVVYSTALRERGRPVFDKLRAMHGAARNGDASEAIRIVRILGSAADTEELVAEAIEYALSDAVRAQDAYTTLVAASGNEHGQRLFERLIVERFDVLWAKFPGMILSRVIKAIENMVDPAVGDRVLAFLDTLKEERRGAILRSAQQGVEGMRVTAAWRARDLAAISAFLVSSQ